MAKRDPQTLVTPRLSGLIGGLRLTSERDRIVDALRDKDPKPIASYLEAGGDLDSDLRAELVHYLRNDKRRPRGRPRTLKQEAREAEVRYVFRFLQWHISTLPGARGTGFEDAIRLYLHLDPDIGEKTLRNYVGRGFTQEELAQIAEEHAAAQSR